MAAYPGPPGLEDFEQGFALRQSIERIVDLKLEPFRKPRAPRVFTENIPFGAPGLVLITPVYLFGLRVTFPARVVGWELWVPNGTATMDIQIVRKGTPTAAPVSIVGGRNPSATSTWVESTDFSSWSLSGPGHNEFVGDELLLFYVVAPTTADHGWFGLSLRDLTVTT